MKWTELSDEACPVARSLSVVGDRWTLLILRDAFRGVRRFEKFQTNLGVTRHVLVERLRRLEANGILRREPYQERPLRHEYRLTEAGKELGPILVLLGEWGERRLPSENGVRLAHVFRDTGEPIEPTLADARSGRLIGPRDMLTRFASGEDVGGDGGDGAGEAEAG
ncbi:transcriptional regulator, HxlR family [Albimonas donghaensis]|uniref:Transcriptional regulator, HxlR family n=1 Tax=Albimonas donghaensis TaxID=356660 RepID=A0A1H2QWK3_9RHOB|nr:helix-turn-helix domain-containing protein [Albimonas donghaensis]SDW11250.1 transcriptional regulator, HxlR family [Albimonas donghaensis]